MPAHGKRLSSIEQHLSCGNSGENSVQILEAAEGHFQSIAAQQVSALESKNTGKYAGGIKDCGSFIEEQMMESLSSLSVRHEALSA
ncbi:hypothetical protein JOB18_036246 [Solea senegalensis]|uniref:Uncharacterized protein n=1 Tax=Solea senegalensis TaxID=28829 RepID=A0AAV6SUV3_SOLSE|nr:hypothetical protein JOB18_036246 [Solea senegalensis]